MTIGVDAAAGRAREATSIQASALVADARELAGRVGTCGPDLPVCVGERFAGVVSIERLLGAAADAPVSSILATTVEVASPTDDQERVALKAARAGARSVAVVDDAGRFLYMVPPTRLIATLSQEHEEDMARLGGFLASSQAARNAAEEDVRQRLWHRLPWLALGLVGAMASAGLMASFEQELERTVLLAFFVPAVVYLADAVGTQTETVVIRGMALGVSLRTIARRELATGAIIGCLLAAVFFVFARLAWGDGRIAATVSIALLVSASIATLIAMTLPYALQRLGRDPAFGSGPLATVIQDLLSLAAYFAVAAALV